jgi:hypothetical protein
MRAVFLLPVLAHIPHFSQHQQGKMRSSVRIWTELSTRGLPLRAQTLNLGRREFHGSLHLRRARIFASSSPDLRCGPAIQVERTTRLAVLEERTCLLREARIPVVARSGRVGEIWQRPTLRARYLHPSKMGRHWPVKPTIRTESLHLAVNMGILTHPGGRRAGLQSSDKSFDAGA